MVPDDFWEKKPPIKHTPEKKKKKKKKKKKNRNLEQKKKKIEEVDGLGEQASQKQHLAVGEEAFGGIDVVVNKDVTLIVVCPGEKGAILR